MAALAKFTAFMTAKYEITRMDKKHARKTPTIILFFNVNILFPN